MFLSLFAAAVAAAGLLGAGQWTDATTGLAYDYPVDVITDGAVYANAGVEWSAEEAGF